VDRVVERPLELVEGPRCYDFLLVQQVVQDQVIEEIFGGSVHRQVRYRSKEETLCS